MAVTSGSARATRESTARHGESSGRTAGLIRGRLDQYWPLTLFVYLMPLWWVLGLSRLILFVLAVPMLVQLLRQPQLRVPRGFGTLVLFLVWVALGMSLLWVDVPGAEDKVGVGPLSGFAFRMLWYLSITIAMLYVLNADRSRLTRRRVVRMFGYLFVVTLAGGLLGLLAPNLDFPSAIELVLPASVTNQPFFSAMFHPRVALASDFLGYSQPRITAPYSYPNTWGNAFGVLLPFFLASWFGRSAGWRRFVGPLLLLVALVPVVYSLNRGLWAGLALALTWAALRRMVAGDLRAVVAGAMAATVLGIALIATPLGNVIALRLSTPHSDDRRQNTAVEVIEKTYDASPILGFGGTRQRVGNFDAIAGGAAPGCHQCSAPPMGTQGFLWGLIFMTGFIGAALMLSFLLRHFIANARRPTALALMTSTILLSSIFYFFVYDSLDIPLLATMVAVGLSAREHAGRSPTRRLDPVPLSEPHVMPGGVDRVSKAPSRGGR